VLGTALDAVLKLHRKDPNNVHDAAFCGRG
jgi:hypothetical protein